MGRAKGLPKAGRMARITMTVRPMLVSSGPLPRDSDQYAFEVKWDGFRALIQAAPGSGTIISRNGNEMTFRYPELRPLEMPFRGPCWSTAR